MVCEATLPSSIEGTSRGHHGAPSTNNKRKEASTILRPEEAEEGFVLQNSSESWSHKEEQLLRSCSGRMEILPEPQHRAGRKRWGKAPYCLLPGHPIAYSNLKMVLKGVWQVQW